MHIKPAEIDCVVECFCGPDSGEPLVTEPAVQRGTPLPVRRKLVRPIVSSSPNCDNVAAQSPKSKSAATKVCVVDFYDSVHFNRIAVLQDPESTAEAGKLMKALRKKIADISAVQEKMRCDLFCVLHTQLVATTSSSHVLIINCAQE